MQAISSLKAKQVVLIQKATQTSSEIKQDSESHLRLALNTPPKYTRRMIELFEEQSSRGDTSDAIKAALIQGLHNLSKDEAMMDTSAETLIGSSLPSLGDLIGQDLPELDY